MEKKLVLLLLLSCSMLTACGKDTPTASDADADSPAEEASTYGFTDTDEASDTMSFTFIENPIYIERGEEFPLYEEAQNAEDNSFLSKYIKADDYEKISFDTNELRDIHLHYIYSIGEHELEFTDSETGDSQFLQIIIQDTIPPELDARNDSIDVYAFDIAVESASDDPLDYYLPGELAWIGNVYAISELSADDNRRTDKISASSFVSTSNEPCNIVFSSNNSDTMNVFDFYGNEGSYEEVILITDKGDNIVEFPITINVIYDIPENSRQYYKSYELENGTLDELLAEFKANYEYAAPESINENATVETNIYFTNTDKLDTYLTMLAQTTLASSMQVFLDSVGYGDSAEIEIVSGSESVTDSVVTFKCIPAKYPDVEIEATYDSESGFSYKLNNW